MTAADLPAEKVAALAEVLSRVHFDGNGCGTHGSNACSVCYSPSPMSGHEVATALAPLIAGWLGEERRAAQVPAVFLSDDHEECNKAERVARSKGIEAGYIKGRAEGAAEVRAKVEAALYSAWDDGNAVGLDGWIGPERGEEPDPAGIAARERHVSEALAAFGGER